MNLVDAIAWLASNDATVEWHNDGRCYVDVRARQFSARAESGSPADAMVLAAEQAKKGVER